MRFRKNYEYKDETFAGYKGTDIKGEKMVKSEFLKECDINAIVDKYKKTHVITHLSNRQPQTEVDVSELNDFHEALNFIKEAEEQFMLQPARLREKFNNDPGKYLAFIEDPKNVDECIKLGIMEKPQVISTISGGGSVEGDTKSPSPDLKSEPKTSET